MKPGQGSESMWWWKVAKHLDETQLALVNAIARNTDDPTLLHAFGDTVRQAQAILLEIFHVKGLLQAATGVPQQPPGGSPWPQFQQGQGHGSPGAWAPQFPQPPQGASSGHGSPGTWPPQHPQAPQPPPSFPQVPQAPPSFPQQGPQMPIPSPPPWIPDFSQMSSPPSYEPPPYNPPPQAPVEATPQETAVVVDPQPEPPPIVPEAPQPVGETEADHPVS